MRSAFKAHVQRERAIHKQGDWVDTIAAIIGTVLVLVAVAYVGSYMLVGYFTG